MRTEPVPAKWLVQVEAQGHGLIARETIAPASAAEEMLMMGLRLNEGVSLQRFEEVSTRKIDPVRISFFAEKNLITVTADQLTTTPSGRLVLNRLLAELLG